MRNWIALTALFAVGAGTLAVAQVEKEPASSDEPTVAVIAQTDQDRTRSDKEIEKLEAQRAEIDARIRDLRRSNNRASVRTYATPRAVVPKIDPRTLEGLQPEQRREVERALQEANRAVQEAMKGLREQRIMVPNVEGLNGDGLRLFTTPDGKTWNYDYKWSPEDREKFKKDMDQLREHMKSFKVMPPDTLYAPVKPTQPVQPFIYRATPNAPLARPADSELRAEIERLRREVESLRDEVRRQRGRGGEDNAPRPRTGLDFFNLY